MFNLLPKFIQNLFVKESKARYTSKAKLLIDGKQVAFVDDIQFSYDMHPKSQLLKKHKSKNLKGSIELTLKEYKPENID